MEHIIHSLRRQREQLLDTSGDDLFSRHTSLLEIAIISLYNRLVNQLSPATEQFRSSGAIIALGALGRGLIGPQELVNLLFLKSDPFPWTEDWLEDVVGPLREAGWNVNAKQAPIATIVASVEEDADYLLDILESRYISGNRELVDQLNEKLQAFIDEHRDQLTERLFGTWFECRKPDLEPGQWLEPSLVSNPGGLNDIRTIRSVCRILLGIRCFEDAIFQGYLFREEVDQLLQAEKFYLRLMSLLETMGKNGSGIVRFDEQELLAEKLGYSARSGFLPVESFLQELYRSFHQVQRISMEFCERLQDSGRYTTLEAESAMEIEPGIEIRDDKIIVHPASYSATASSLVHLFVIAAKHRGRFSSSTRTWLRHHGNLVETAAGDPKVRRELLDLLVHDDPELSVVRRFYDYGLMTALIPELAPVHCLVQHDAFHVYPVHEHHLRTLSELKKMFAGKYARQEPELSAMAEKASDSKALYLAAILHDIGKNAGHNHAFHGGEIIPSIARRLGLDTETSSTLQFLVAQHLLLMDSASMRDLADNEMISQCAAKIGRLERLYQLALLSFADMWATGPKARAKWRETPVLSLCDKIRHILEKGEPSPQAIADRIQRIKSLVAADLNDLMDGDELEQHFEQSAPRYLLSMEPSMISRHLRLERALRESKEPFIWEVNSVNGRVELTILSWELPGLLARMAGILTLHDLDINGAQVFTKTNGVVLLIFQCRPQDALAESPDWNSVRRDMKKLLEGKLALDYRIALHALERGHHYNWHPATTSQVHIDNEASQVYTILEVYTTDRVGLLYTITRTLMDLQVRVYVAKITTKVDQVADIFYLKTATGSKITDPDQMEEIRNALLFRLDGPPSYESLNSHSH